MKRKEKKTDQMAIALTLYRFEPIGSQSDGAKDTASEME